MYSIFSVKCTCKTKFSIALSVNAHHTDKSLVPVGNSSTHFVDPTMAVVALVRLALFLFWFRAEWLFTNDLVVSPSGTNQPSFNVYSEFLTMYPSHYDSWDVI